MRTYYQSCTQVVGFAADAEILCVWDAASRYTDTEGEDHEGNPITAIFAGSADANEQCHVCGEWLSA